jgi:hypothetical protein
MEDYTIFTCADFWKDIKQLSKDIKPSLLEYDVNQEEFENFSASEKFSAIPLLRQISNTIKNKFDKPEEIPNNDKNGQQPFLSNDWVIWKMRWAVDNRGARYGLRIMYSINGKHIIFSSIKRKKEVKDSEAEHQKEAIDRLKVFFDCTK